MNTQSKQKEVEPINWKPQFFADIDEDAEDSDYLQEQQCCTSCGAYTGDLPGYYWIEDSDDCPICRSDNNEEKWSDEVKRLIERNQLTDEEIKQIIEAMAEYGDI